MQQVLRVPGWEGLLGETDSRYAQSQLSGSRCTTSRSAGASAILRRRTIPDAGAAMRISVDRDFGVIGA